MDQSGGVKVDVELQKLELSYDRGCAGLVEERMGKRLVKLVVLELARSYGLLKIFLANPWVENTWQMKTKTQLVKNRPYSKWDPGRCTGNLKNSTQQQIERPHVHRAEPWPRHRHRTGHGEDQSRLGA